MPYSLTGTGTHAISGPCWLEVSASPIASTVGSGNANPTNYFGLAQLRFISGGYALPPHTIDAALCLVPVPLIADHFGYEIVSGTTLTVTEVNCLSSLLDDAINALFDSAGNPLFG